AASSRLTCVSCVHTFSRRGDRPALPSFPTRRSSDLLFDASGHVSSPRRPVLRVRLQRPGARLLEGLLEFLALGPDRVGKRWLHWSGHNALDLLGHLYEPCAAATGSATGSATPGTSAPGTTAPDATAPCRAK